MRVSEFYKLGKTQAFLDFVDIPIDTDLPVFVDPSAIKALDTPWGNRLSSLLQSFFETVIQHIKSGQHSKAKELLSSLRESNHFHLGYSQNKAQGRAFGPASADTVWGALTKSKAAITGLLKDLEDTVLLIPGIGTDMISDAVCNILREPLIEYTQQMCEYYGIPLIPNVQSGPLWNATTREWTHKQTSLPITKEGIIILVPKIIVRMGLTYEADQYYRHFLLPEMQQDHIKKRTALAKILKNGAFRVTKKSLIAAYGSNKDAIVTQTKQYPYVLQDYKDHMNQRPLQPLDHSDFNQIQHSQLPDISALIQELQQTNVGATDASRYENVIEKIFTYCLYPSLAAPRKQHPLHQGRKRVDITYSNEAKDGFFAWLAMHYTCPQIFVECKNYGKELGNPELDQLAGRFGPSRGKVGMLVCRSLQDKKLMIQRCIDTAKDQRGYIMVLDDDDVVQLLTAYVKSGRKQEFSLLRDRFNQLIS